MSYDIARLGGKVETLREQVSQMPRARRLPILGEPNPRPIVGPTAIEPISYPRLWFWTALSGLAILLVIFGGWELLERQLLEQASTDLIYVLHLARGVSSAILLGTWVFFVTMRTRKHYTDRLTSDIQRLGEEVRERSLELERSRAFTEHLFDTLHDRIVVTDHAGNVVKVNRVARESIAEPCVVHCGEDEDCGQRCRIEGDFIEKGKILRDPATGRLFAVDRYPVPARAGEPELVLEVARDVTDAKRLEALVVHQEKMASLGLLASGIAHDIGNPLASLSSELEMIELEDDPERLKESAGVLREHVDRIGRTLREMVDFARRRGEDELGELCLATAIDDALRLVRHDRRMRNVRIEVQTSPDLPPVCMVEDHLVMVLVNLALNALDAMPDGGTLQVSAEPCEGGARVVVADSGEGMSSEVLARAFDPLFTTKQEGSGTGLGLSVSQGVIRGAGGDIEVQTAPGEGTDVILTLPAGGAHG